MADGTQGAPAGAPAQGTAPEGGAPAEGTQPAGAPAPNPADVAAKAAADKAAAEAATGENEGDNPNDWPESARREVARLRKERGDERINAKTAAAEEARKAVVKDLMSVLDPDSTNETPSPEALLTQVQETQTEARQAKIQAALIREAWAAGVDPARLDYLEFKVGKRDEFGALDLATPDWSDTLRTMVADEVAKDGTLKASGARKGTGDGQYGGSSEQPTVTPEAFARMTMQQRTDLYQNNRAEYDRLVTAS